LLLFADFFNSYVPTAYRHEGRVTERPRTITTRTVRIQRRFAGAAQRLSIVKNTQREKALGRSCTFAEVTWKVIGVARICCGEGQSWKLGHGALTADLRAGCSFWSTT